ncbi:hypothetical protein BGV40_14150 [Methanosarcina sp. Ant1]|nr:hypothetical protein BGV40_14150 [Methanosarcina sp. Ant1]
MVVNLIAATTTSKKHDVKCLSDTNKYPTGIKIEKKQVEELGLYVMSFTENVIAHSNQRIR